MHRKLDIYSFFVYALYYKKIHTLCFILDAISIQQTKMGLELPSEKQTNVSIAFLSQLIKAHITL